MNRFRTPLWAALLLLSLASPLLAGDHEARTLEAAREVVRFFAGSPRGIPPVLLREAVGVAVIPHVVKAGLVVDHRFGRGVVVVRQPDGRWSHPVFVTLTGGGVGLEAGVEATDLVLIFKTPASLDRVLKGRGRLTLGRDAAVAVGPLGREAEAAGFRRAEVYSYSHSRGLFAGVSVEGDRLQVDGGANEAFYSVRGCRPDDVLARRGERHPAAVPLLIELDRLTLPPGPPPVVPVPADPYRFRR